MPDLLIFAAAVCVTLAAVAIAAGAAKVREHERRITDLEKRANPASKHDLRYLERHDLGEAALMELASMRSAAEELQVRIEQASRRYEHVAHGGHPDDPPSKWMNGAKN